MGDLKYQEEGVVRVIRGPDPTSQDNSSTDAITGVETLLSFGIRDGSRPVSKRDLLLPSGDYLVGVFQGNRSSPFALPDGS